MRILTRLFGRDTIESDALILGWEFTPFSGVNSNASLFESSPPPTMLVVEDCIDLATWLLAGDATICCTPSCSLTASRAAVSSSDSMVVAAAAFLRTSGSEERRISCRRSTQRRVAKKGCFFVFWVCQGNNL